jgi:putative phosphoesterase
MRVAFLSDVHANIHTLTAAVKSAFRNGCSRIFVAGDLVGRGSHPLETLCFLKEHKIPCIRGNVERKLLSLRDKEQNILELLKGKKENLAWTALQLDEDAWSFMERLPERLALQIEGFNIFVVHGSPLSDKDYVYPSITSYGISTKMNGAKCDLLVCGHSHIPFVKIFRELRVVNCGSVGMSVDGDPHPSYAIAELSAEKGIHCRIIRFSYSLSDLLTALKTREIPGIDEEVYWTGVKKTED